jgi:hypothetical protein
VVYFDEELNSWVGADPRIGDTLILATTKEEAEVDLKLLIAEWAHALD